MPDVRGYGLRDAVAALEARLQRELQRLRLCGLPVAHARLSGARGSAVALSLVE